MSNNDEHVSYKNLPEGVDAQVYHKNEWEQSVLRAPRVALQRIVYPEEVRDGLDVTYTGSRWNEKPPEVTQFLDSYYRLHNYFKNWQELRQKHPDLPQHSPSEDLAEYIAQHYYDCMSGGLPDMVINILRRLLEHNSLALQTPVYPGKIKDYKQRDEHDVGGWYTLEDFLVACDSYHNVEPLDDILQRLRTRLPPIAELRLLQEKS